MSIVLARVDDRLLHGQVATSWVKATDPQVVVVVDDKLPDDPLQTQILKMAAPNGVKVYVMTPEKITEKLKAGVLDAYRVMLIFAGVEAPLKLIEAGVELPSLNVGGMRFREGRERISKTISMTPEEKAITRRISETGIEIEHRQLHSDGKIDVMSML